MLRLLKDPNVRSFVRKAVLTAGVISIPISIHLYSKVRAIPVVIIIDGVERIDDNRLRFLTKVVS